MVGRKRVGEQAMTASERQRRKRHLEEARTQRAEQAHEVLAEANVILTRLSDRLNGKERSREIQMEIGRVGDLCCRARFLLEPVYHLPVHADKPRQLICGSSDYVRVANGLTFTLIHKERRCPECAKRRHEFYL